MDLLDQQDLMVHLAQPDRKASKVMAAQLDHKVILDQQAQLDQQAFKAQRDLQAAQLDLKAQRESPEIQAAQQARLDQLAHHPSPSSVQIQPFLI
jgi:hypothetical protein